MPLFAKIVALVLLAPVVAEDGEDPDKCITQIICPFLSALVNEGILPVKDLYTREELFNITIAAGLGHNESIAHGIGNFENIFSDTQDIFNMEGAPNEHANSTGVHDCPTMMFNCRQNMTHNFSSCQNITLDCQKPNPQAYEKFFQSVDSNNDETFTSAELEQYVNVFPHTGNDFNPIGRGDIRGSHQFILEIFGSPKGQAISKEALHRLFILRRFPDYFEFPHITLTTTSTTNKPGAALVVPAFDCSVHGSALQLLCSADSTGCWLKELVPSTGTYSSIFPISPVSTSPPMIRMNAIAINPTDSKLYSSIQLQSDRSTYFCRFGKLATGKVVIQFLGRFPSWTYTGAFDAEADSFWYRSGRHIYVIDDVSKMAGHVSTEGVVDLPTVPKIHTMKLEKFDFSDNVVLSHVVSGQGESPRKLFIAITDGKVFVLDVTSRSQAVEHILTPNPAISAGLYGAAWVNQGNAEFAANDGSGIVHVLLDTLNYQTGQVGVKLVGKSEAHNSNDGTMCPAPQKAVQV